MRLTLPTAALAVALVASAAPRARAGDFMDTRLSFNATDENVLITPNDVSVGQVPGFRFASPSSYWQPFFDQYDTRYNAYDNETNLVMYKLVHQGQSDFEGAFALRLDLQSDIRTALFDVGSYLKWTYWFDPGHAADPDHAGKTNLAVTAFPYSSDPMRLGYSYKISWGGSPFFGKPNPDNPFATQGASQNLTPVPGLRVQLSGEKAYGFVGMKTTVLLDRSDNQQKAEQSFLGGAGVDVTDFLRLEANGGFFNRQPNPKQDVIGAPTQTFGGSGQLLVHHGVPVGRSGDFAIYKNDPTDASRLFQPEEYPGGLAWLVSTEATWTGTTLENPDRAGSTMVAPGMAGDVNVRVKYDFLRVHADLMYRDLMYVLLNVPSFVPFQAISPAATTVTPETMAAAGADYFFSGPGLTLGLTAGIENPATYSGNLPKQLLGNIPSEGLPARTVVVVRSEGNTELLPAGTAAVPIITTDLQAKLHRGAFDIVGDVIYGVDNNRTILKRDDKDSSYSRTFSNPYQLGFNLAFQGSF